LKKKSNLINQRINIKTFPQDTTLSKESIEAGIKLLIKCHNKVGLFLNYDSSELQWSIYPYHHNYVVRNNTKPLWIFSSVSRTKCISYCDINDWTIVSIIKNIPKNWNGKIPAKVRIILAFQYSKDISFLLLPGQEFLAKPMENGDIFININDLSLRLDHEYFQICEWHD